MSIPGVAAELQAVAAGANAASGHLAAAQAHLARAADDAAALGLDGVAQSVTALGDTTGHLRVDLADVGVTCAAAGGRVAGLARDADASHVNTVLAAAGQIAADAYTRLGAAAHAINPSVSTLAGGDAAAVETALTEAADAVRAALQRCAHLHRLVPAVQAALPRLGGGGLVPPDHYRHLPVHDVRSGGFSAPRRAPDRRSNWSPELMRPEPNTVYRVDDRALYVTDHLGRVVYIKARPRFTPRRLANLRRHSAQTRAGGRHRREDDEGGHWLAASLGGAGELVNLIAMGRRLNQASLRNMYPESEAWRRRFAAFVENWYVHEKHWRRLLRRNPRLKIELEFFIRYPEPRIDADGNREPDTLRPSKFTVYSTIGENEQTPMRFRN